MKKFAKLLFAAILAFAISFGTILCIKDYSSNTKEVYLTQKKDEPERGSNEDEGFVFLCVK